MWKWSLPPVKSVTSTSQSGSILRTSDSIHSTLGTVSPARVSSGWAFKHWLARHGVSEEKIRQPELVRDSSWLAGSDLIVIALGLLGQAFLAANLLRSDYGLLVVLIDAFALIFLLVDAGLPTIITRDIPRSPSEAKSLVMQSFKWHHSTAHLQNTSNIPQIPH